MSVHNEALAAWSARGFSTEPKKRGLEESRRPSFRRDVLLAWMRLQWGDSVEKWIRSARPPIDVLRSMCDPIKDSTNFGVGYRRPDAWRVSVLRHCDDCESCCGDPVVLVEVVEVEVSTNRDLPAVMKRYYEVFDDMDAEGRFGTILMVYVDRPIAIESEPLACWGLLDAPDWAVSAADSMRAAITSRVVVPESISGLWCGHGPGATLADAQLGHRTDLP